jgi:hypothetical protein
MDEMLAVIRQKHRVKLDELILLYKYRFYRYGLQFSLLFCSGREDIDLSPYASLIRLTDSFAKLENNFYVIVYEGVDTKKSLKAAQNIIERFKRDNNDKVIYVSAVSATECPKDNNMIDYLFERHAMSEKGTE